MLKINQEKILSSKKLHSRRGGEAADKYVGNEIPSDEQVGALGTQMGKYLTQSLE